MPNKPQTHSGSSLRKRAARAAQLTSEQRKARDASRSAASASTSSAASHRSGARASKSTAGSRLQGGTGRASKGQRQSQPKGRAAAAVSGAGEKVAGLAFLGRHRVLTVIVVLVVFLAAMLYPVGQTCYQSMRQEQRLDAQVAAVNARNASLKQQNKDLNTEEGIADAAREQGYVRNGDKAAVITNSGESTAQSSEIPGKVDVDSIEAPHTWYYDILDAVFFVQYE